jgi:hypothetical protein
MTMHATLDTVVSTREEDGGLSRCAMAALLLLILAADRDGLVVATTQRVADRTGYSVTNAGRAMRTLEERGYLIKERRSVYRIPDSVVLPQNPSARGIA